MTDDLLMGIPVMYPSHVKQLLYADILDMVEARLQATQKTLVIAQKKKMRIFFCLLPLKECSLTQNSLDTNAVQAIKVTRK